MTEVELSYTTVRTENKDADPHTQQAWQDRLKMTDNLDNEYMVVMIGRTRNISVYITTYNCFTRKYLIKDVLEYEEFYN